MAAPTDGFTIKAHFEGKDAAVRQIYDRVLKSARKLGAVGRRSEENFDSSRQPDCVRRRGNAQKRDHSDRQERS